MVYHPFARHRRNKHLTQVAVADYIGSKIGSFGRLSVIRLEQGMFGVISDDVLESLSELYDESKDLLEQEYRGYQREQRQEFRLHHPDWRYLSGYQGKLHPLIYYRTQTGLTRNGLCKGLCLDYGPISDYEHNNQRTIPQIIKIASEDMRWDWTYLEREVLEWRSSGRSSGARIK